MKSAIFDMDGTVLDSMREWDNLSANHLLSLGVEPPADLTDTIKEMSLEDSLQYLMKRFGLWRTKEELLMQMREQIHIMYRDRVELKPYALKYLEKLKKDGIPFGIATATPKKYAEEALTRLGVYDLFDFVICEDDVGADKHSPDIYLEAARRLGTEPCDTAVFEDAPYAARTAKTAGFIVYVIEDKSFIKRKEELLALADKYVTGFDELL
ncbi:MAG: HAD family phosphatase [Clostridia bacterium]|nr:HAD family phosphatase [Clostridia bacterium]